jgi:hypothetical protein
MFMVQKGPRQDAGKNQGKGNPNEIGANVKNAEPGTITTIPALLGKA